MRKFPKILFAIFLLSLFLRIYRLNTFPMGFHVDEAKVAWESYSILKTGKDDHGNLLALYYNSFGDYRPAGIFYTTIPFLILFGKTNFAVRFSSAFLGALTVFPVYYLAYGLTKNRRVSLFSVILLSIIPWHLATSRATSEVIISCFLVLSSLVLVNKKTVLSFILMILSFLFYHSARVEGPILMLVWIVYLFKQENIKNKNMVIGGFLITSVLSLVLLLSPAGRARYEQVKIPDFNFRNTITSYTNYFNPNFFIDDIARPFRYTTKNVGIVSIPIFVSFLIGIYVICTTNKNRVLILLFALGPIPASLTLEDSPNLHRSFFMLPFLVIIAAIGLNFLFQNHKAIFKLTIISMFFSLISFLSNYFNSKNNSAYIYRNPQVMELVGYIKVNQMNYTRTYVTNDPDSPYPWFYFFSSYNPKEVNTELQKQKDGRWQYENIIWENNRCPRARAFENAIKDKDIKKILVVENGMCTIDPIKGHSDAKVIKEFEYNGKINYRVWEYEPIRN